MKRRRYVLASFSVILLGAALLAGYWWHYKLGPRRHLADPDWLAAHSEAARWKEEQKDYRRLRSSPDLCFRGDRIGYYGNKEWFLWLEEQIRHPDFRHCGCTEYALALMANRQPSAWKEWIDANRARSQEEWIRDGFLDHGVTVHLPSTPNDTLPLLRLLGRKSWNVLWGGTQDTNAPGVVPNYIQYNAYRWLRDSGFNPGRFVSSNAAVIIEADVAAGLIRFSHWRAAVPGDDGSGVLAFGKAANSRDGFDMRPVIVKCWMTFGVDGLIAVSAIGGVVLAYRLKRTANGRTVNHSTHIP